MKTQTTKRGTVISNISWDFGSGCQKGTATLTTGEVIKVWRGGYEAWGEGWIPCSK